VARGAAYNLCRCRRSISEIARAALRARATLASTADAARSCRQAVRRAVPRWRDRAVIKITRRCCHAFNRACRSGHRHSPPRSDRSSPEELTCPMARRGRARVPCRHRQGATIESGDHSDHGDPLPQGGGEGPAFLLARAAARRVPADRLAIEDGVESAAGITAPSVWRMIEGETIRLEPPMIFK